MPRKAIKSTFSKKTSQGYQVFNPHDLQGEPIIDKEVIVVSIDPGIVNCGIYICKKDIKTKKKTSLYLDNMKFCEGMAEAENFYYNSLKFLDTLEAETHLLSSAHYIIVEAQMRHNRNTRVGQHLMTYFMTRLRNKGNRPWIIEITAKAKTNSLGCPKMDKPAYKKWCANRAIDLLQQRKSKDERMFISSLRNAKKKDDMGDVICQYEAWDLIGVNEVEDCIDLSPIKEEDGEDEDLYKFSEDEN